MKKDWKDIEGQLVRIDIGSTFKEANSDSTDASIICFTTDGHIVLNGVDYIFSTGTFKDAKQTTDWVRKYIQMGDASHPFLRGRMTDTTYNIGWMRDGFTYSEAIKIPLISEEQQGLVDWQSYTDYIQPLLQGKYDERMDNTDEQVQSNTESIAKMDSRMDYMNTKVNENADAINKLATGGKVDLTGYVRKDDLEKVRLSAESNKAAIDKMNQSVGQPGGLCTLDDDGVVSIGNLPDEVFDVGVFHGIVELEEGQIETYKPSMGVLSPDTPGCHVVYDRTSGTFALCKVTDEDGEPVYIYYNNWVQANKPIGKWSYKKKAILPVEDNIYIDADTSTAYYCNGEELVKLAGGSSDEGPMQTIETIVPFGGILQGLPSGYTDTPYAGTVDAGMVKYVVSEKAFFYWSIGTQTGGVYHKWFDSERWQKDGKPKRDVFFLDRTDSTMYYFNGTELVNVGGYATKSELEQLSRYVSQNTNSISEIRMSVIESAYDTLEFSGVKSLFGIDFKQSSISAKPEDENCSVVYDTLMDCFVFCKKVSNTGDYRKDYEYYSGWATAQRYGEFKKTNSSGMNDGLMGIRPVKNKLYLNITNSQLYYYNGTKLVNVSAEGASNSGGSSSGSSYTLPMAAKDTLGGVKVGGDVRTSTDSLPLEGASVSRELDGTILVPYAFASSHGESYDRSGAMTKAQVRKLYGIEEKAQANKIEGIKLNGVLLAVDKDKNVNIAVSGSGIYSLPMATDDTLGGVKVGIVHTEDSPELECAEICREADGTITVPCASVTEGQYGQVFASAGAMSGDDAAKLHGIEEKAQVNKIEGIMVNGVLLEADEDKNVNIVVSGSGSGSSGGINSGGQTFTEEVIIPFSHTVKSVESYTEDEYDESAGNQAVDEDGVVYSEKDKCFFFLHDGENSTLPAEDEYYKHFDDKRWQKDGKPKTDAYYIDLSTRTLYRCGSNGLEKVSAASYDVLEFGAVKTDEVNIKEGKTELTPDDEGCSVVYVSYQRCFFLRHKTGETGDDTADYEYYGDWPDAFRYGSYANADAGNAHGYRPERHKLYICKGDDKPYYWDGEAMRNLLFDVHIDVDKQLQASETNTGGIRVGKVYETGAYLPDVSLVNLRETDGKAFVNPVRLPSGEDSGEAGVMTVLQAQKLNGIAEKAQVNVIEGIKVNGEYLPINGHKDVDIEIPTAIGALDLGKFSSESAALAKLGDIDVCGRTDVTTIVLRYGDGDTNSVVCHQCIDGGLCRQVIFNKTKIFHRSILFTDGTRKNIQMKEDWQFLFMDRLEWDSLNDKYVPSQFGNTFNSGLCKPIPTATTIRNGLMSKDDKALLEKLAQNAGSGGSSGGSADTSALNALAAKVEQMQQEIAELKDKLTVANE